jgi:small subunit ribosomal protein S18
METETYNPPANHIDYKDIMRLRSNVNPHARILNRRRTGMTAKGQRNLSSAVKRARFMALLPYIQQ